MAKTPPEYAKAMLAKASVTIPELSFALGTPERKLVDLMAESLSEADVAQYLSGSLLDIETKAGLELEQFVAIFGFGRLQGRQATGVIRVELSTASVQNQEIAIGTQFYTKAGIAGATQQLYFSSTQPVVLTAGTLSIDVPVQCTQPGSSGNVPPDSVVSLASVIGTASCTNLMAMTGGVDAETDDELRTRFKDTLLRNVAGTEDWYRGLCIQNKFVQKVAVFGPTKLYRTQIVAPSTTLSVPVNQDVKYVWPKSSSVFINLGEIDQTFYNEISDYTLSPGASPVFTRISAGEIDAGDILNLEFEYTTKSSSNDPANGVFNKVDVYVDGIDPYSVTERTAVTATTLSSTPSNELYIGKFDRFGTSGTPSATNRFMRLGSTPLLSFPSTLNVDSTVYTQGVHYHVLTGTTLDEGSTVEVAGIEWLPAGPANGTPITVTYVYNRLPEVMQAIMRQEKQITTDVKVHQAKYRFLKPNLNIQFDRSYSVIQVTTSIQERLRSYFAPFPFGGYIKLTDVLVAVRGVPGVANVSITTSTEDASHYGVEVYDSSNDPSPSSTQTDDFKMDDNMIPVFLDVHIRREATS